ncbi:DUF317 domain-containing protein [Streptomyces stelliscabiei]|uniref:DUF317 domain-containing protein n=1 Tax=Streptomyces stelliscabiei TaxID=146820 RepID=UPI002FF1EE7C
MESPDRTVRVAYDPYVLPGGWTIHGQADGPNGEWSAPPGAADPVEMVAGLTDAPHPSPLPPTAPNVWAAVAGAELAPRVSRAKHYMATSPRRHRVDASTTGRSTGSACGDRAQDKQGNGWTANFTAEHADPAPGA